MKFYHVTALSNFAKAYDKYARVYDKSAIPQSSYPGITFVLDESEVHHGVNKTAKLLSKLNIQGDAFLVMAGIINADNLHVNDKTGTGIGRYIDGDCFPIDHLFIFESNETLKDSNPISVEEAYARSLAMQGGLSEYVDLIPRSVSWLPVAITCQAKCKFCFSEASVSFDQKKQLPVTVHIRSVMKEAAKLGAERFVITGGGEPGLLHHKYLLDMIQTSRDYFPKAVMITNGVHLSRHPGEELASKLSAYETAGLNILAISRHHYEPAVNQLIMGIDTKTEIILEELPKYSLISRLICVLQKGGIDSAAEVINYINWAADHKVDEVCFKELYVSTTLESVYAGHVENKYSEAHQVSLSVVLNAMTLIGFEKVGTLPWGAPIFAGSINDRVIKVAAYTEPSMFWERQNKIARSWNIMQDGQVLASLEDPTSVIEIGEVA